MDLEKIRSLGGTWSDLELGELLDYGISPVPKREKNHVDKTTKERYRIKEYFITPDLLPTLSGN